MMKHFHRQTTPRVATRRGGVLVLAAGLLVLIFAFTAFTVDVGLITVTKGQLQNAADSASHSGVMELYESFGSGATRTNAEARAIAEGVAQDLVNGHRSGDLQSTPLDVTNDLKFGNRSWNSFTSTWVTTWDATPYNVMRVRVRRARENQTALPLAFARVMGSHDAEVGAWSTAAIMPGVGFTSPPGDANESGDTSQTVHLFPFTVDLGTWNDFMTAYTSGSVSIIGQSQAPPGYSFCMLSPQQDTNSLTPFVDNLHYNPVTGCVEEGGDGIPELNIYPDLNSSLPPGNRGTVDLGAPGNSTNDLQRQIKYGLNAYDFSFFPNGEIRLDKGPLYLNGDTGISAGMNSSLQQIKGQLRCIPIFISVSGPGNNAQYLIVKFVGIRVMASKLNGGPNSRYLYVEPAPFYCPEVIRADTEFSADSIMSAPVIIDN